MRTSDVSTTLTLGRDTRSPTPPQPTLSQHLVPEGRSNHQHRSIEAWRCDPRPHESLPSLTASADRSGAHTDAQIRRLHNANPRS
eukprot:26840-Prymnesium_polylepis.1